MENNFITEDEREIDILDMLGRIICRWRSICVVVVLGLLAGIAISCAKGYLE